MLTCTVMQHHLKYGGNIIYSICKPNKQNYLKTVYYVCSVVDICMFVFLRKKTDMNGSTFR